MHNHDDKYPVRPNLVPTGDKPQSIGMSNRGRPGLFIEALSTPQDKDNVFLRSQNHITYALDPVFRYQKKCHRNSHISHDERGISLSYRKLFDIIINVMYLQSYTFFYFFQCGDRL